MSFEALTNHREYLSAFYLAEVLPATLKKDVLPRWAATEKAWAKEHKADHATPRQGLRALRQTYFALKSELYDLDGDSDSNAAKSRDKLRELHGEVLRALGFAVDLAADEPDLTSAPGLGIVQGGWAVDTDAVTDADGAGRLLEPYAVDNRHTIDGCFALTSYLFTTDEPPRYVLILNGGVLTLADRHTWAEGRYLAVSLDVAFGRNDARPAGELDAIAALFGADSLLPPPEGGDAQLAKLVAESRQKAVGVSGELREGLRTSVELIANEVLDRIREQGVNPTDLMEPRDLARSLGRESLRYLYRILFLLYAEARPELGVLPSDDREYIEGYSVARLGDLVSRKLGGEQARQSFHLYESLDLLFRMVNEGHEGRGTDSVSGDASEGVGIRFEALKSDLFLPEYTEHIGRAAFRHPDDDDEPSPRMIDTRLRNGTLYQVLRLLMLTKGKRKERGGFISYAQLGINQLGAVYEGLMSYSGFIAAEELYEVAKGGDSKDGSWMVPASKVDDYADEVFVTTVNEETGVRSRVRHPAGSFVYRLAGRDRQTSASYYTPQSLTEVTVQLALKYRLDQEGTTTAARELLDWTICEPALGSGAFLNEAINQVAAEYLRRRQSELDTRIDPDQYATELQKIKAYIALHNSYGVDLNRTAVELAEVSMWLNVMHKGLQAPWFGLHLRRGNSLIGARRQYYTPTQLADKSWLTTAPTDHPLRSTEPLPSAGIHHFLVPADGWGAVAGEKAARALAPEDAKRLADWRRRIKSAPTAKGKNNQIIRLQAISRRVELLWDLVRQRLALSEQEIRRDIAIWGVDDLPIVTEAVHRNQIKADLEAEGGPYWRLKTLMDAWCALWFWPLDQISLLDGSDPIYQRSATVSHVTDKPIVDGNVASGIYETTPLPFETGQAEQLALSLSAVTKRRATTRKISVIEQLDQRMPLADLDNWLEFAEAVVGRSDIPQDSLVDTFTSLASLKDYEEQLPQWTGTDPEYRLPSRFPWLSNVTEIAEDQGFLHWEMEFAQALTRGGFDLQVGNPPWVRPDWDEPSILAEGDPWFKLTERPDAATWQARKTATLTNRKDAVEYLSHLCANSGTVSFVGSRQNFPLLVGTRPDLYRVFLSQVWRHLGQRGSAGLVHPDSHFTGANDGRLRAAAYGYLRVHGGFVNTANWAFVDASRNIEFGSHIYGPAKMVEFRHLSRLFHARTLVESLVHDGSGPIPGQRSNGMWDLRPHKARVVTVDDSLLENWHRLLGSAATPSSHSSLLAPLTTREQDAITALADFRHRLGKSAPFVSAGYNEANSKAAGLISYGTVQPTRADDLMIQGPHIGVSAPFSKQPRVPCRTNSDWDLVDFTTAGEVDLPRTNYVRPNSGSSDTKPQDVWAGRNIDRYRLAWRAMVPFNTERSLFAALIPPGPTHVNAVHSLAMATDFETALNGGFWASLPLDYLLRITNRSHLQVAEALAMPAAEVGHPLASALLLRTLRLNCLTRHYADLWSGLFQAEWAEEDWVVAWPGLGRLATDKQEWTILTALRNERERRSALVEIDALVAVWLGIGGDELVSILDSRYPILTDRESEMWFDSVGRRIARDPYAFGFGQVKGTYERLMAHLDSPDEIAPPEGYSAPFFQTDREGEYRQAHAVFSARLQAATDAGWEPSA